MFSRTQMSAVICSEHECATARLESEEGCGSYAEGDSMADRCGMSLPTMIRVRIDEFLFGLLDRDLGSSFHPFDFSIYLFRHDHPFCTFCFPVSKVDK